MQLMLNPPTQVKNIYYPFSDISAPGLICTFTDRILGNTSLEHGDTADSILHRKNFLQSIGINYEDLVCARQVHGKSVKYARQADKGKGALSVDTAIAGTDAFITDKKNLPLAIFTADCLSIFIYDPFTPAIGLVHAGWRSTKEDILTKTVELMTKTFVSRPRNLCVGFGPSLRSCCYEVGDDFSDIFSFGLIKRNRDYCLDLTGINKAQALGAGIKDNNIFDSGICTSCRNQEFFSYRREADMAGRIMSVMMLV